MNLVEEALTNHWGPKCSGYEAGCIVCDAWRQYENLVTYGASQPEKEKQMKTYRGVVVTTYQEELYVEASSKEEAEMLMYDKANPMGDGYSTEMEAYDVEEYKPQGETE